MSRTSQLVVYAGLAVMTAFATVYHRVRKRRLARERYLQGFRTTRETLPDGRTVVRIRGSYDDLRNLLDPSRQERKPALPEDLDIDGLPSYWGGCPHCGKMSIHGENQWRYHELSRTRGPGQNTTTFLTLCQACGGFMKCTVDHDD